MAKLYFYYAAMNAGKSAALIQAAYNYHERGMSALVAVPHLLADKKGANITSRTQLSIPAWLWGADQDIRLQLQEDPMQWACVMVDEAQFLTRQQVDQLCQVVDTQQIPVLAYGLRTNYMGELFEGSQHLLALADHLEEIKTMCFCGKKATMTARFNSEGKRVRQGQEIAIGGNEQYVSLCRAHYATITDQNMAVGAQRIL